MPWRHISANGFKGWKKIKHHEYYDAYQSEVNPEMEVEIYLLDYIPQNDMVGYEFRMQNTHPFIPQILDIATPQTSKQAFTKVVMEHTPLRLDQCRSLPDKPIQVIVAEVFLGFQAIFKQYGPFRVKENMIGFDKKGNPKVWMNCNFAKNHMNPFDVLKANRESVMIKNIFDLFEPFGYCLENQVLTFEEAKILVMKHLMDQNIQKTLLITDWKQKIDTRPKSPFIQKKQQNGDPCALFNKPRNSEQKKRSTKVFQTTSSKSISKSRQYQKQKFSRSSIQSGEDHCHDIPSSIQYKSVKEYLGSEHFSLQSKLMYILFLRQNPVSDEVNDIVNIFEFAIEKDPSFYSMLLQIKGDIQSNPNIFFQSKILKIKDLYNGHTTEQAILSKTPQSQKRFSQSHIFWSADSNKETRTIDQLLRNDNSLQQVQSPITPKQDDLIQSFDRALEKFVQQKQKIKIANDIGYVKKYSSTALNEPFNVPLDKRATGISQKWQLDSKSVEDKMKIKQKNFASLKEQAARVLGL